MEVVECLPILQAQGVGFVSWPFVEYTSLKLTLLVYVGMVTATSFSIQGVLRVWSGMENGIP